MPQQFALSICFLRNRIVLKSGTYLQNCSLKARAQPSHIQTHRIYKQMAAVEADKIVRYFFKAEMGVVLGGPPRTFSSDDEYIQYTANTYMLWSWLSTCYDMKAPNPIDAEIAFIASNQMQTIRGTLPKHVLKRVMDFIYSHAPWQPTAVCANCSRARTLQWCGGCGKTRYCGIQCQRTHWKNSHKKLCNAITRTSHLNK